MWPSLAEQLQGRAQASSCRNLLLCPVPWTGCLGIPSPLHVSVALIIPL